MKYFLYCFYQRYLRLQVIYRQYTTQLSSPTSFLNGYIFPDLYPAQELKGARFPYLNWFPYLKGDFFLFDEPLDVFLKEVLLLKYLYLFLVKETYLLSAHGWSEIISPNVFLTGTWMNLFPLRVPGCASKIYHLAAWR